MPPFHSRSTGACRIALSNSAGASAVVVSDRPSAARACEDTGMDLAVRGQTPPPAEIFVVS